jgi:hypothetical protein
MGLYETTTVAVLSCRCGLHHCGAISTERARVRCTAGAQPCAPLSTA